MPFVYRWDDQDVRSTIPNARIGILPGQSLVALLARLPPGVQVPYQTHPTEQLVHMLSGCLRIWIDGYEHDVVPGEVVLIPPDVPHRGEAIGDEDAVYLEVLSPVEQRYRDMVADVRGAPAAAND